MAPVPAPITTDQPPLPMATAKPKGGVQVPSWVIIPISIIFGLVLLWILIGLLARRRATTSRVISERGMHNRHKETSTESAAQKDDERLKNLMLETHKEFASQYGAWNPDIVYYQTRKTGEAASYVHASQKAQERNHIGLVDTLGYRRDRTQHSADRPMGELPPLPVDPRARSASVDTTRGRSRSFSVPRAHPPTRSGTPHPRHRRSRTVGHGSHSETSQLTIPLTYCPPRFSIESAPDSDIMGLSDKDKNESSEKTPMIRFSPLLLALNLEDPHPTKQDRPLRVVTPERRVPEVEGTTDPHTRIVSHYGIIGDAGEAHPLEEPVGTSDSLYTGQKDDTAQFHLPKSAPKETQKEKPQTVTPPDSDRFVTGGDSSVSENGNYGNTTVQKLDLVRVRTDDEELDWPLPKSPPVQREKVMKEAPQITIDLDSEPLDDSFMLPPPAIDFRNGLSDSYAPVVPARGSSRRA